MVLVAGGDRRGLGRGLDRGGERIVGNRHGAVEGAEAAADLGDHEVTGDEADRRVARVDVPDAGVRSVSEGAVSSDI